MPADDRLGSDDDEGTPPTGPEAGEGDPEGGVDGREAEARRLECVGRMLLAEGELDDRLLSPTAEEGGDGAKNDRCVDEKNSDHVAILREDSAERETDSEDEIRILSVVDRTIAEWRKLNDPNEGEY